jgi:hypothetical protein
MINYKAIARVIMRRRRVDEGTALSAIAQAYLKLDTTRPENSQASYLIKAGCFYVYEPSCPPEDSIEPYADSIGCRTFFDEESFMRSVTQEAGAVVEAILDGHLETLNERGVRRVLQFNNLTYSRRKAKEVIHELLRTRNTLSRVQV